MKTIKIAFSKLIGHEYDLEIKMAVLDWMLKTGNGFSHQYGWYRDGINKSLFGYSANNYDCKCKLPDSSTELNNYFDAIFARAVYGNENKPLKEWREKESIYPSKYRMLKFNFDFKSFLEKSTIGLIFEIQRLDGKFLKDEFAHPDYSGRTEPKILSISIYTIGHGWIVDYTFSFKEFNYEPGWTEGFIQEKDESIRVFLNRVLCELSTMILTTENLK